MRTPNAAPAMTWTCWTAPPGAAPPGIGESVIACACTFVHFHDRHFAPAGLVAGMCLEPDVSLSAPKNGSNARFGMTRRWGTDGVHRVKPGVTLRLALEPAGRRDGEVVLRDRWRGPAFDLGCIGGVLVSCFDAKAGDNVRPFWHICGVNVG